MDERIKRYEGMPIPAPVPDDGWEPGDAQECGEAVLDITGLNPRIDFDASYRKAGIAGALTHCYVRAGVYDRLCSALALLPEEYSFLIYDSLRPQRVQQALYDDYYAKMQAEHPNATPEELESITDEFVALPLTNPLRPSSHQSGGAVDLTLCRGGVPMEMGTVFDEFAPIAHTDWFEREGMDETVRRNRRVLYHVMREAGFTNYECEWWHYDWGDRSWARRNHCASIYTFSDSPELF